MNITEGATPVANVNNALRSVMAQLRSAFSTALSGFFAGTSALPVANGGTGGTTAAAGRTALAAAASGANSDITSLAGLTTALSILQGGTGATSAAAALTNLGAIGVTASSLASPGYVKFNIGGTNLIVQWGTGTAAGNGNTVVTYPTAFTTFSIPLVSGNSADLGAQDNGPATTAAATANFTVTNAYVGAIAFWWIAVGV